MNMFGAAAHIHQWIRARIGWFTAPWRVAYRLDEMEIRLIVLETWTACACLEQDPPDDFRY